MQFTKQKLNIWQLIARSLHEGIPVMLLYVLESRDSSPGRQGFFMAVNRRQEMAGSIGGGIMEHKFVELAKVRLQEHSCESKIIKQVHDKSSLTQSGMICSGEQTIFMHVIERLDLSTVENIITCITTGSAGRLLLSPDGISFNQTEVNTPGSFRYINEKDWFYSEKLNTEYYLYIIGGGHCSVALSALMSTLNFYITIIDDRKGLHTMINNDYANELMYVEGYEKVNDLILPGRETYIVIMTFGYRSDDVALRALLNSNYKYLGVLGSETKINKMFEEYRSLGIPESVLQHIHAPVGIKIQSQTPEEIAVSIAAEIIKERRAKVQC